jgi:hypothetical protein
MTFATYPSLAGKTASVTGGASGIGAEIVRASWLKWRGSASSTSMTLPPPPRPMNWHRAPQLLPRPTREDAVCAAAAVHAASTKTASSLSNRNT